MFKLFPADAKYVCSSLVTIRIFKQWSTSWSGYEACMSATYKGEANQNDTKMGLN